MGICKLSSSHAHSYYRADLMARSRFDNSGVLGSFCHSCSSPFRTFVLVEQFAHRCRSLVKMIAVLLSIASTKVVSRPSLILAFFLVSLSRPQCIDMAYVHFIFRAEAVLQKSAPHFLQPQGWS